MSLENFFIETQNKSDKYDLGYISEFYDTLFSPIKDTAKNVFEIGIYGGESIKLWHDYFTNAVIHCADIKRCVSVENYDRIKYSYQNAYDINFVNKFEKNTFDVVIDDGPHTYSSMVFYVSHYLDLVKEGGLFILEDIIDRSWTPKLLSLLEDREDLEVTVYDMRNKQKTPFLLNKWKNGLDVIVIKKLGD